VGILHICVACGAVVAYPTVGMAGLVPDEQDKRRNETKKALRKMNT